MIIFYPFFILISIFFPRQKKLWVFGCHDGYWENTRYFFDFSSDKKEFDCYWLANNEIEANQVVGAGRKSILKRSIRGYWISARAECTFICTGFSDVNRLLALKSKVINFWHGTPIKKIYLDSVHDLNRFGSNFFSRKISIFLMKFLNRNVDFYFASNSLECEIVSRAAGFSLGVGKVFGSPRFDKIRNPENSKKLLEVRNKFDKVILFAPTWREAGEWKGWSLDSDKFQDLNSKLKLMNAVVLVKPHPLTQRQELEEIGLVESENIIYSSGLGISDINLMYAHTDILITDVSSSMFDYLIFSKPLIMFMPDVEEYVGGGRGVYEYFLSALRDNAIRNWGKLIDEINCSRENRNLQFQAVVEEVAKLKDTNARIYNYLKAELL